MIKNLALLAVVFGWVAGPIPGALVVVAVLGWCYL